MKITKTFSFALMLSMLMLVFTTNSLKASEVPADNYTYKLSGEVGTQSEKIEFEEYAQDFSDIFNEEGCEVVLVEDGAEVKFTPNEKMSAVVSYYTFDGEYGGALIWTIDGSEAMVSEIEANKTASVNLYERYGGFTCDLYYVFSFGDSNNNVTRIIYKVDGTVESTSKPAVTPLETVTTEPTSEPAVTPSETVTAKATASEVLVNGKQVSFEAYNINGSNYFKLRDIAMAVNKTVKNFEVGWDSENNAIMLTSDEAYTSVGGELVVPENPTAKQATLSTSKVYLDGQEVQLTAYMIGGNNYFKLRDIGEALGIDITWDPETSTIGIDTSDESL